jgi:hypothetical protein
VRRVSSAIVIAATGARIWHGTRWCAHKYVRPHTVRLAMKIVLAFGSLAADPDDGARWAWGLEHLFGFDALGHDVFWLESLASSGDPARDQHRIGTFLGRVKALGMEGRGALLLFDPALSIDEWTVETAQVCGTSKDRIRETTRSADLVWNLCGALRRPLLSLFRRRVLVDWDPGILQVSALARDPSIREHHVFLSVGAKIEDHDCEVPRLGLTWHRFTPFVYLPMWPVRADPGQHAPFTDVVHWSRGELRLRDRTLSTGQRDGYLRYADLPGQAKRPFELAARSLAKEASPDRERMLGAGWTVVDAREVAGTPDAYRTYIAQSRAQIACPTPISRELKTGSLSDRSVRYLATGRPVLAEDTGFSEHLPTGQGLVGFRDIDEAREAVADIDANYEQHSRAAREMAVELFDARRCLQKMLSVC